MGLSQALSTAMSGLRATQASLSLVSSNVANAETPGYVRKTTNQVTGLTGDYGSSVLINGVNRQLDQYLQTQVRTEMSGATYSAIRSTYLSNLQSIYGNPGDSGTIEYAFNNLLTAVQGLSTSPDSQAARIGVVNAAHRWRSSSTRRRRESRTCAPMPKPASTNPSTSPTMRWRRLRRSTFSCRTTARPTLRPPRCSISATSISISSRS